MRYGCVENVPDYDDEADLIGPPACRVCGGALMFLGSLGRRDHYRCRYCGADRSTTK